MDFPIHLAPEYAYRPYYSPLHQEDELWDDAPAFKGHQINRVSANGSPTLPALDRFLQERDGPSTWFKTRVNEPQPPFPGLDHELAPYHDHYGHSHGPYRYPSPTESGNSSSAYSSTGHNDHHSTPWSSPNPSVAPCSPELLYLDHHGSGHGFRYEREELKSGMSGPCVTMHEVQGYEDAQPEAIPPFEDEGNFYALPQEGFEPMEHEPEPEHDHHITNGVNGVVNGTGSNHRDVSSPESPNIRRRRPTSTRSPPSPTKVTKRPGSSRRTSSSTKTNGHKNQAYCQSTSNRAFPCPFAIYSCTSTFGAKNEWKRHVNTQHMQTGFWRCDQCDQSERKPNDFNRKDLFIQHVRRMHPLENETASRTKTTSSRSAKNDPEEREMNAIATRCFMPIREPPAECACLICDATFTGSNAWDERLEHIGKHWEATKKENEEPHDPKEWREDRALHDFLDDQGIIAEQGKRWILA